MKKYIFIIICLSIFSNFMINIGETKNIDKKDVQNIVIFCYHDVVDSSNLEILNTDPYAISTERLEEHFKFFKQNGYTPISLKQYDNYLKGKAKLPKKPIILTFDDGRESMYTHIYPLLKKYNYPAVFAIILSYMDKNILPTTDIKKMVSWQELKEMQISGLVEVASHTYDLHNFIVSNKYGDKQQNVTTIKWHNDNYETEMAFNQRIDEDMQIGNDFFLKNMGNSSNILVWPYGVYNDYAIDSAKKVGYKYQMMLNDDVNLQDNTLFSRYIIYGNPTDEELLQMLEHNYPKKEIMAAQVDIDMIYDNSPEQFEKNINATIDKIRNIGADTVFLQTFADEDGDGDVNEVYFHTNLMKVKADVFSHVTIRLKNEGLKVYAWMPVLSYPWMVEDKDNAITASEEGKQGWYTRATPFSPMVKQYTKDLVKDLALYAPIDGILFQDDLYMNDFEDFSIYAKEAFKKEFHKELTKEILEDEKIRNKWTKLKTKAINDLTKELIDTAKKYRPEIKTARNIYPIVILEPESEEWFAQNYEDYLDLYDYVVIMAYPEMEEVENTDAWLEHLVQISLNNPKAKEKAIFKLQGYDWKNNVWINNDEQNRRKDIIEKLNGKNMAIYPIDVFGK